MKFNFPGMAEPAGAVGVLEPLSSAEFERLDDFLADPERPDGAMLMDEINGLFTCLSVAPRMILPSAWLPVVFDGGDAGFRSEEEAVEVAGLLLRYYNQVLSTLSAGEFAPLYRSEDDAIGRHKVVPRPWCRGFLAGVTLDMDSWTRHLKRDSTLREHVAVISALATAKQDPGMDALLAEPDAVEALDRILCHAVTGMAGYWKEHGPSPAEMVRPEAPSVGRNDPCPCGSGQKYKRCCGSAL